MQGWELERETLLTHAVAAVAEPEAAGPGGISLGLLWKGALPPTVSADTDTTITNGNAGTKGVGGVRPPMTASVCRSAVPFVASIREVKGGMSNQLAS